MTDGTVFKTRRLGAETHAGDRLRTDSRAAAYAALDREPRTAKDDARLKRLHRQSTVGAGNDDGRLPAFLRFERGVAP